ncbi:Nitrate reductase cytochrome c-type subunit (NapB)/NapC/NirT cytochrome c family, N-terminal region [Candidatus Methanoperedens nitroreducens]|uniref:Nitrate reductase cytochrome c-type subunit (NapB)/NapC/NirT cytochrome c family, N-terminal region n=1 Tax=Candidatus Methanoperedens nitratireducens TaxID=1392998 RepID=A0A062VAW7_9EURY|nr:multiheme c-type cytochrome [Candidatus Methanoperedens nitroreducens]KCZ72440.1 Nitrate reductase cytochrome c-type subunit (NapB)/NapC/NirT cytochrome c family, N-terminal region [Candidatus Methanoperedens nitroreducens]MDJ1423626.1 multiheme c-type cytochrome [Candidatus Methanoperedens sp.]
MISRKWLKVIAGTVFGLMALLLIQVAHAVEEFQISYSCIDCHQDRYNEWARSMHAIAVSDPVFEAAYIRALKSDPEYRYYCLTCHSPTTIKTNDFNLTKSVSIEGVTCSFCHTVTGIENNSYVFNQSNPMQGPYDDSNTDAHDSAYSPLLTTSEFCAVCHEFSINGVPVYETYTEWKESPYAAEGKQCQDCHMETKSGVAAKDGPVREKVYQHFWYGGHSGQFLEKAFQIESRVQQIGDKIIVTLNVTNSNVGHMVPSGFPSRKVILDFKASDGQGKIIFSDQRVYAKTLLDTYGNEVNDFWKAASIARDNRIKPKESRIEVFEFEMPEGISKLNTQATLIYQLNAEIITRSVESMNVEIAKNEGTTLLSRAAAVEIVSTPKEAPTAGWAGFIAIMVAAVLLSRKKRT